MQARIEDFRAAQAEVAAVSPSSVEDHRRLADRIGASFPILSDPRGEMIRAYGVLHPHAFPGVDMVVARPAEFIVDRGGVIRGRFLTKNWRVRERPENILRELDRIP